MEKIDLTIPVEEKNLPSVILKTYENIVDYSKEIRNAIETADNAKNSANSAKEKDAKWKLFKNNQQEAIEALQTTAVEISEAQVNITKALESMFRYQEKMSKALKFLFSLGVRSIAANRTVVRELQLKLKDASEETISKMAHDEIMNVVNQLKAQEDMMFKIESHGEILKDHHDEINNLRSNIQTIISANESCQKELDERYNDFITTVDKKQIEDFAMLQQKLREQQEKNETFIALIDKKQDEQYSEMESLIEDYKKILLDEITKTKEIQDNQLEELKAQIQILSKKSIFDNTVYKISIGIVAIGALACSIFL